MARSLYRMKTQFKLQNDFVMKVLKKRGFFKELKDPLYIGKNEQGRLEEPWRNKCTFFLTDSEKDILKVQDLKAYFDFVIMIKKKEILARNIKRPIVFRVWHDTIDNWLRYNLISKNEDEILERHTNQYLTFVDSIEEVCDAFLSDQEKNRESLIVPGEEAMCPLEILEEQEKNGCVSKEFLVGESEDEELFTGKNYTMYEEIFNDT